MYSTKLVNKGVVEGNKYITIGDPYRDPLANTFRQDKKGEKNFKVPLVPMNAENGNFGKLTYAPSAFRETNMYLTTQPLESRKKGFGSKDAHKRDEFTSAIRTEQYRQSIRTENEMSKRAKGGLDLDTIPRASTAPPAMLLSSSGTWRRETLYDIGRSKVTEFDPKSSRDRFYKRSMDRERNLGPYRPTSTIIGESAWNTEYKPPTHGAASLVKVSLEPVCNYSRYVLSLNSLYGVLFVSLLPPFFAEFL